MIDFDKSEEIRELIVKYDKLLSDMSYLKENYNSNLQIEIQKIEKPLKSKIVSLEYELRIHKDKVNTLTQQYELSKKNDDILSIMDKLSVMFLTKNSDPNFLSPDQQKLIKSLFGDYGSRTYKEKIKKLEEKWQKLAQWRLKNSADQLKLINSNIFFLNILLEQDKYKWNDKFLRNKIDLLEMKASINEESNKRQIINEWSEDSNLFSDNEEKKTQDLQKSPWRQELNVSEINRSQDLNNFLGSEWDDLDILHNRSKLTFTALSSNDL